MKKENKAKYYIRSALLLISMITFFLLGASHNITNEKIQSTGIPILYINTDNHRSIKSKIDYVKGQYSINQFSGKCKIRGHGNTTWITRELYKKPYLLTIEQSHELGGLRRGSKWILMANTADKSTLRNTYGEYLSNKIWNQGKWAPKATFVNLILNGKYQGLYKLTEKIEMEEGRLMDYCGDGSFLACVNSRMDKEYNFITNKGIRISIRSPESDTAHYQKWESIINSIEDKIYSLDWSSLSKYIDKQSFVDWYLINDFSKNHDSNFGASCFMYYDTTTEKLYMGPSWDFDLAFGNISWDNCENPEGYWVNSSDWYKELWNKDDFRQDVKARWLEQSKYLENHREIINSYSQNLSKAISLNSLIWHSYGKRQWPHAPGWKNRKSHEDEIAYLNQWIEERYKWYDKAIKEL